MTWGHGLSWWLTGHCKESGGSLLGVQVMVALFGNAPRVQAL